MITERMQQLAGIEISEAKIQINDKFKHKKSGKVFVVSSIGENITLFGDDKGEHAHLYPVGTSPDDRNAMTIPVGNVKKFFTPVNESFAIDESTGNLETDSQALLQHLKKITDIYYKKNFPRLVKDGMVPEYEIMKGKRWWRIVRKDKSSRSAWGFIDTENGDVMKPASWKAPAKHARGNVHDKNSWKTFDTYSPGYLSRRGF